jgi:hypothetical protein
MDVATLAALAGNALVTAAVTDGWENVRHKVAALFGRGKHDQRAAERFDQTRAALTAAPEAQAAQARAGQAASWTARLTVLLEDHPDAAEELQALVTQIQGSAAVATDHSVAAARDVVISASDGGVAAGVIHGNVAAGPTRPDPASS